MKYSFDMKVKITNGFYKGYIGKIQSYKMDKDNKITYNIPLNINGETINVIVYEHEITKKTWYN